MADRTDPHGDELRQLEERLLRADVRRSSQDLRELLADEFVEFGSSGRVFDKEDIIGALQNEPESQVSLVDFKATVLAPGVALTTYRTVRHGPQAHSVHFLRSSIWRLRDDRWQMIFHQGTPTSAPNQGTAADRSRASRK